MVDGEVLGLLRNHPGFLSGESISRHLKLTRTAVWKRIKSLRDAGYVIEASTRSGYRLSQSPDLLLPFEIQPLLQTKWLGREIHYLSSIDSTNSAAYQLALRGAREGEVVIAESQDRGRGRLGRKWISPPFLNLYLSVILRPKIPLHQASLMTFVAAVATANAIETYSGISPVLKWPNDLLLRKRKVAGLLNEIDSEADRIHFVILGIGVNLNMDRRVLPRPLQTKVTALKQEMGRPVSRKEFVCCLLKELEQWYEVFLREGSNPILKAWREKARIEGKKLKVTSFGEILRGQAMDIDSDGALILRIRNGEKKRIVAGDVEML